MAITENGSFTRASQNVSGAGPYTLSISPAAVGDLMVVCGRARDSTATTTITGVTVSGGGCINWREVGHYYSASKGGTALWVYIWIGTVQSTGAQTVTVTPTVSAGATTFCQITAQEFTNGSSSNRWNVDGACAVSDNSTPSTSVQYPSRTPSQDGELYFGYGWCNGTGQTPSSPTANCTYYVDANTNESVWDSTTTHGVALAPVGQQTSDISVALGAFIRSDTSVAYDTSNAGSLVISATTPWTWSHAIGSDVTNGMVFVSVYNFDDTTIPSSVTVGGVSAQLVGSYTTSGQGDSFSLWAAPTGAATGGQTVNVNWASGVRGAASSESVSGAQQSVSWVQGTNWQTANNTPTTQVTLNCPASGLVISGWGSYTGGGSASVPTTDAVDGTTVTAAPDQAQIEPTRGICEAIAHTIFNEIQWTESTGTQHDGIVISAAVTPATAGPQPAAGESSAVSDAPVVKVQGPVTTTDIQYLYSGSGSGSSPQLSTGGAPGGQVVAGARDNVWQDVTSGQAASGVTQYSCLYVKNANAFTSWQNVVVWVDGQPAQGSIAIGLDSAAIGQTAASSCSGGDNTVAPTGGTPPSFSTPTTKATGLAIGTIPAGSYKAIWLRRTINPGASAGSDAVSIRAEGDTV